MFFIKPYFNCLIYTKALSKIILIFSCIYLCTITEYMFMERNIFDLFHIYYMGIILNVNTLRLKGRTKIKFSTG